MRVTSFDLETHLIKAGCITPRMVCLTYAERDSLHEWNGLNIAADGIARGIMLRDSAIFWVREKLTDDDVILIGHNVWFDLGVCVATDPTLLPLIFRKLDLGLIRDTQVRQQMLDIATGSMKFVEDEDTGDITKTTYHLDDLSLRLLKKWLKKKDTWRLKYALLDGVPLSEWPEDAKHYAIEDAVTTLKVYEEQDVIAGVSAVPEGATGPDGKPRGASPATCDEIPNAAEQHRAAWGLHLQSAWGVRTDPPRVAALKKDLVEEYAEITEKLRPSGFLKFVPERALKSGPRKGLIVPAEISRNMKVIKAKIEGAYAAKGEETPRTDPSEKYPDGQVATDKKTLLATGDPELKTLSERGAVAKLVETYVPILESGTRVPINARYNVLVETGRTSCSKPNLQNPPRKGGVRECFIPREGWVYVFCDYDSLELRSLAQVCLDLVGHSEMAEALRKGEDLHLSFAADMLGITYAEAVKRKDAGDAEITELRQFAKICNFGFPGGLSAPSFVEYAEGYGVTVEPEKAKFLRDAWFKRWSEMRPYFAIVSAAAEADAPITQVRSGRVRGGATYCAIANGWFQGLASDGFKEALYRVAKECYVERDSALFGARPVFAIHDELGLELPYAAWGAKRADKAANRLREIMIEAMQRWVPDIPITCKPVMCRRWYKGVEQVFVDGVLVPAKPVTAEKDGKKKTTWVADA